MSALTLRWGLAGGWVLVAIVLYQLVPQMLSFTTFLFIAAVLMVLALVVFAKSRDAATHESMADAIYKMDHPSTDRKS